MKKIIILLLHAFIGWAICAAIMGIGMSVTTLQKTLVLHAVGGPLAFIFLSIIYYKKFNYTTPLVTAAAFIGFIIFMDVFLVAMFIEKSFAMFHSILGTWLPFTLIFLATYITGIIIKKGRDI